MIKSVVMCKRLLGTKSVFFLQKDLHTKCKEAAFIQMLLYAQKVLKSKQAASAHKQHKK